MRRSRFEGMFVGMAPPANVNFPSGGIPRMPGQLLPRKQDRGLNENYGREVMELHTVGVNGGYTQEDVIQMADCLTGWTIRAPRRDPQFFFDDRIHDQSPKVVMGKKFNYGGMKDGLEALHMLATSPHTAHHISFQLAQHFVSDNPPQALVDRMAQTFLSSDGDIRAVLKTMIYSPEFWSRDAYRAKVKTPFEVAVSAARAVDAETTVSPQLVQWIGRMGEPLYQCEPPTGYCGHSRRLGECRRTAQSPEFCARRSQQIMFPASTRILRRSLGGTLLGSESRSHARGERFSRWPDFIRQTRDTLDKAACRSADFAGPARRSDQACERRPDRGPRARRA